MAFLAQIIDGVIVNRFDVQKGETTIGRSLDNMIVINDSAVSGLHAVLSAQKNANFDEYIDYAIIDKNSKNGVFVNEIRVEHSTALYNGDEIRIAWNQFTFYDENEQSKVDMTVHLLGESQPT